MCVVSMIGDHYGRKWTDAQVERVLTGRPSVAEFEALKKEVQEMKELLKKALEYDRRTGQPQCEQEDKIALLKRVAEAVGVDLKDIF